MDIYKLVITLGIMITLLSVGSIFQHSSSEWDAKYTEIADGALFNWVNEVDETQISAEDALTPQNENTQDEGSAGLSMTKMAINIFTFFGLLKDGLSESMAQSFAGMTKGGAEGMIYYTIALFMTFLTTLLGIKVYLIFKNKDT